MLRFRRLEDTWRHFEWAVAEQHIQVADLDTALLEVWIVGCSGKVGLEGVYMKQRAYYGDTVAVDHSFEYIAVLLDLAFEIGVGRQAPDMPLDDRMEQMGHAVHKK